MFMVKLEQKSCVNMSPLRNVISHLLTGKLGAEYTYDFQVDDELYL